MVNGTDNLGIQFDSLCRVFCSIFLDVWSVQRAVNFFFFELEQPEREVAEAHYVLQYLKVINCKTVRYCLFSFKE